MILIFQALIDQKKLDLNYSRTYGVGKIDVERWNSNYEALIRYGQQFGHCNVPQATVFPLANGDPCKLGHWINKQRKDKKNECLLPDRERKLQILVDAGLLKWNMNNSDSGSKISTFVDAKMGSVADENINEVVMPALLTSLISSEPAFL